MKLIIQIPCKDEEKTLPVTLADLPREIPGIDAIERLVINDGSRDATLRIALDLGVEHILHFAENRGLARTFQSGLTFAARALNGDIIINVDADNQYKAEHIPEMVALMLENPDIGIVLGERDVDDIPHFSPIKRRLSRLGALVVSWMSGNKTRDAVTGFRAYTNKAAQQLSILSRYTYTLETLMQARGKGIRIASVTVGTNPKSRESRLMRSTADYIRKSLQSLIVFSVLYEPILIAYTGMALGGLLGLAALLAPAGYGAHLAYLALFSFVAGGSFSLLDKALITMRIQNEELLRFAQPRHTPQEWAKLLGCTQYYHMGRPIDG